MNDWDDELQRSEGSPSSSTVGILDDAAVQDLINLDKAIAQLQQTNFRVSRRIIQAMMQFLTNLCDRLSKIN